MLEIIFDKKTHSITNYLTTIYELHQQILLRPWKEARKRGVDSNPRSKPFLQTICVESARNKIANRSES